MSHYCYQGVQSAAPPSPIAQIITGVIPRASSGNWYFWLQIRNLAGYGVPSPVLAVNVPDADNWGIRLSVPSGVRPIPNGTYQWKYAIMASRTNDISTASVIAIFEGYELDGSTEITLPASVDLTEVEHIALAKTVLTEGVLPGSGNRVNGMRRLVDSSPSKMVEWSDRTNTWKETVEGFNTSVSSAAGERGAIRDLALVNRAYVEMPTWDIDPSNPHRPLRYWLINDTNVAIPSGTPIVIGFSYGNQDWSTAEGLVGGVELTFLGYTDISTGVLDVAGLSVGTTVTYQGPVTPLRLQKDLPPGNAYILQVQFVFEKIRLRQRLPKNAILEVSPAFGTDPSVYFPFNLFGSYITKTWKMRRVVPQDGLFVLALKGSGVIELGDSGCMTFNNAAPQIVAGLQENTADQLCLIATNGTCFVSNTNPGTGVALRAKVGTVNGVGKRTAWTAPLALQNKLLSVSVQYPTIIRSDYPDVIAGSSDGDFNATHLVVYVKFPDNSIRKHRELITPGTTTQEFTIGTEPGTQILMESAIAENTDADFGLYQASDAVANYAVINGTSTFISAGTYTAAIAFEFDRTITAITHDPSNGCIEELEGKITDLLRDVPQNMWASSVAGVSALRAIPSSSTSPNQVRLVKDFSGFTELFYFDATSTLEDSGTATSLSVKPFDKDAAEAGRWRCLNRETFSHRYLRESTSPPATGAGEIALFMDAADKELKMRYENNGAIARLGLAGTPTGSSGGGIAFVDTWEELAAITVSGAPSDQLVYCTTTPAGLFYYDSTSTRNENNINTVRPSSIAANLPGRWILTTPDQWGTYSTVQELRGKTKFSIRDGDIAIVPNCVAPPSAPSGLRLPGVYIFDAGSGGTDDGTGVLNVPYVRPSDTGVSEYGRWILQVNPWSYEDKQQYLRIKSTATIPDPSGQNEAIVYWDGAAQRMMVKTKKTDNSATSTSALVRPQFRVYSSISTIRAETNFINGDLIGLVGSLSDSFQLNHSSSAGNPDYLYTFISSSVHADDGSLAIKPNSLAPTEQGRWILTRTTNIMLNSVVSLAAVPHKTLRDREVAHIWVGPNSYNYAEFYWNPASFSADNRTTRNFEVSVIAPDSLRNPDGTYTNPGRWHRHSPRLLRIEDWGSSQAANSPITEAGEGVLYMASGTFYIKGPSGAAPIPLTASRKRQVIFVSNNQVSINLTSAPSSKDNVDFYVNGIRQTVDQEYTLSGSTITWVSTMPLNSTDRIEVTYI